MSTTVSEVQTLDEAIGANIRRLRVARELSVTAFAAAMRDVLGVGWQRQEVYRYEAGTRSLTASELVAVALVLEVTVGDLGTVDEHVRVGARDTPPRNLDGAFARSSDEERGWQRYEEARDALVELRNAGARYANKMGAAQNAVRVSPALRRRIEAERDRSRDALVQVMSDMDEIRRAPYDPPADDPERIAANATPGIVAATHALDGRDVDFMEWVWRLKSRSNRG